MSQDVDLWKTEDWYPPLSPPKTLKEELLRDEDFIEVDKAARETPASLKDSFDKLVQHLTSHLNSDLHKLRAIFVWMGANKVGTQEETESCENSDSPRYYLKEAYRDKSFVGKLFAKMCRCARIPCILVRGKAKGSSYEPGDNDVKGENTWAVVYVASSWRFVFPHWAFVGTSGYQTENWMLVEDCGKAVRTRFTESEGNRTPTFKELYFLTDPDVMKYKCHPNDKDKQLLTEPWTKEKFLASPFFKSPYFSSGWHLISPLTCVIKSESGCCSVDFFSPGGNSKLKHKLFFDEGRSGRKFPEEIQADRYVIVMKQSLQTMSFMARLPEVGTYKLDFTGVHERNSCWLVKFRIDCDDVPPETRPFPSHPQNGFGFYEVAAKAGLSEPSHSLGIVPVTPGEVIDIHFKVEDGIDISPRLVHSTRSADDLKDNVRVQREGNHVTVTVRLPADDVVPEYSLELDAIEKKEGTKGAKTPVIKAQVLNYLLTSDKRLTAAMTCKTKKKHIQCCEDVYVAIAKDDAKLLEKVAHRAKIAGLNNPMLDEKIRAQKAKYKRLRKEVLDAAEGKHLDRLSRALKHCITVNLQYRPEVENTKEILFELCNEEVEKAVKNLKVEELRTCLKRVFCSCVGEEVQKESWFKNAQEVYKELEELQAGKKNLQSLTEEDFVNVFKPPDHVVHVIFATFVLLGNKQSELSTWQKVWTKLKQTNEEQLFSELSSFDDSMLTPEQVNLAVDTLQRCDKSFGHNTVIKKLHAWCSDRIKFYRLREKVTRRN